MPATTHLPTVAELRALLDAPQRAAVTDLATEPALDDRPDATRFSAATSELLTRHGVLDRDGFVTQLGLEAGWAFIDDPTP